MRAYAGLLVHAQAGPRPQSVAKNQNPNQRHFDIWPKILNFREMGADFQKVMDGRKAIASQRAFWTLNAKCLKY